jgi:hypothetical protein
MDQFGAKQIYKDINDFVHMFIDELCLIDIPEKVRKEARNNRVEYEELKKKKGEASEQGQNHQRNQIRNNNENSQEFQGGRLYRRPLKGVGNKTYEKKSQTII